MNKVVYVAAHFQSVSKKVTKEVPTGEKTKGFFGGEKEVKKKVTEWVQEDSDRWIDGERLAQDIATAVEQLNEEGYEVVTVTPITSGKYNYDYYTTGSGHDGDSGYGYGYGYSYTEGVTIVARKLA